MPKVDQLSTKATIKSGSELPGSEAKSSRHLDRLFDFLVECIRQEGAPPTYAVIGETLGYSKGLVARRIKQLHEQKRLVLSEDRTARTLRIVVGQGEVLDTLATQPYLTEDRKAILKTIKELTNRKGIGPSINAIARAVGFSTSKTRRHVEYLDKNMLVRHSEVLNEVIVINPGDYDIKI